MKKIFYEKIGRKYVPVKEYDQTLMDAMPKGAHLVCVYPGGQSTRYNVNVAYAPMIAAGRVAQDAVCKAIAKAQEVRPKSQPFTEHQMKLWRELAESFRQYDYPLIWPAAVDAGEAAVKAMMEEAEKLMTHPSVKKAYEHFLLVCELTKDEQT
jgi:hypothetical protein